MTANITKQEAPAQPSLSCHHCGNPATCNPCAESARRQGIDIGAAQPQLTDDMRNAVRWAPSSAYWSEKLKELFGPNARDGIDALEKQLRDALKRIEELEKALKEAADYTRHPDYDWPVDFSREVHSLLSTTQQEDSQS